MYIKANEILNQVNQNRRNYHYNQPRSQMELSDNNPFKAGFPSTMPRRVNGTGIFNTYTTPLPSTITATTQVNPLFGNPRTDSLNPSVPSINKFLTNVNPIASLNQQERVINFGQDNNENSFKRALRKPAVSNLIQNTSYNIISNIPNISRSNSRSIASIGGNNLLQSKLEASLPLSRPSEKVEELFFNYNKPNTVGKNNTITLSLKSTQARPIKNVKALGQSMGNSDYDMNNERSERGISLSSSNNSNKKGVDAKTPKQVDTDASEYYVKNAYSVKEYAYKEDQNFRFKDSMEDAGKAFDRFNMDTDQGLFCLYDGHGGAQVSQYTKNRLPQIFEQLLNSSQLRNNLPSNKAPTPRGKPSTPSQNTSMENVLSSTFAKMDEELQAASFYHVGSTACVVYLTKEKDNLTGFNNTKKVLYCANIGDTRCVVITNYGAKRLSYDDRATDKNEFNRITSSGGIIFDGRVYGQLMLSRAFGDFALKQFGVISIPHVTKYYISERDKYVIIASDGIWDVISDEDIYVLSSSVANSDEYAKSIIKNALARGTFDNISCFVLKLN